MNKMTEGFCQESRINQHQSQGYFLPKLGVFWFGLFLPQATNTSGENEMGKKGERKRKGRVGKERDGRGKGEKQLPQLPCNLCPWLGGVKFNFPGSLALTVFLTAQASYLNEGLPLCFGEVLGLKLCLFPFLLYLEQRSKTLIRE